MRILSISIASETTWVIEQVQGQDGSVDIGQFFKSQYSAILTGNAWSILNDLLEYMEKNAIFLQDTASNSERARWCRLERSGSQSQHRVQFILSTHTACHKCIITGLMNVRVC